MIALDPRTVVTLYLCASVVCTLVLAQLWQQNRGQFAGIGLWLASTVLQTFGLFLLGARGALPDWLSIVVANALLLSGMLLIYVGLERFTGKAGRHLHDQLLLAACMLGLAFYGLAVPDLRMRLLIFATFQMVLSFECAWLLLRRVTSAMRPVTRGVGMVFAGYGLVSAARIAKILAGTPIGNDFFDAGGFEALVLVGYLMLFIVLVYGLALMVNQRLIRDVDGQREKFAKAFHLAPYAIMLTHGSDGTIMEVNQTFESMAGYDRAEVVGKKTTDLQLWGRAEDRAAFSETLSRTGRITGKEMHFRKKSGEEMVGLLSAQFIPIDGARSILSCVADISEHKAIEAALQRESQALHQRNEELARFNRLAVGRELEMIRLKQQVNALSERLGLRPPHALDFADAAESRMKDAASVAARKA